MMVVAVAPAAPALHLCFHHHRRRHFGLLFGRAPSPTLAFSVISDSLSSNLSFETVKVHHLVIVLAPQIYKSPSSKVSLRPLSSHYSASSIEGHNDPELRSVLELATDSELCELQRILFGPSYFSPLLKSVANRGSVDYHLIGEDLEERDYFISLLESRFLFLAADARATLRGWRPSYRDVLLGARRKLNVPCSSKLSTENLEVEIFLHILREYSGSDSQVTKWKVQGLAALRVWAPELRSAALKGGGVLTLAKIYKLLAGKLSGKVFLEAAKCQVKNEVLKKGGQLAAVNLESKVALHVAKQGFARALSSYVGLRSVMVLLGPMLWGTFLADVFIQMLGTDYARILRAICTLAQIRITRKCSL